MRICCEVAKSRWLRTQRVNRVLPLTLTIVLPDFGSGLPRRRCPAPTNKWRHPSYDSAVMLATDHTGSACRSIVRGQCQGHRTASAPCLPKFPRATIQDARQATLVTPRCLAASVNDAPTRSSPASSPHSPARTSGVRSALALAFFEQHVGHAQIRHQLLQPLILLPQRFRLVAGGSPTSPRHEGWSERHRALRIEGPIDWGPGYREQHSANSKQHGDVLAHFRQQRCLGFGMKLCLTARPVQAFELVD